MSIKPRLILAVISIIFGAGLTLTLGASLSMAATVSLSGPMVNGDVTRFVITPDGQTVIFTTNERVPGLLELYRVSINGGEAMRLSTELTSTKHFVDFKITSDGQWVIYSASFPQDVNYPYDQKAIYRHPIDDSQPSVRLSQELSPDSRIMYYGFQVSSDGQYVVYRVCSSYCEIFSASVDGSSPPVKLNKALPNGGTIWEYRISPNGQSVVYIGEQDTPGVTEIYSVPIEGPASAVKKLNSPLIAGGNVNPSWFSITPTSEWVLYYADQDVDGVTNLYSTPIDGNSPSIQLNLPPDPGQPLFLDWFLNVTSDGKVVYLASINSSVGKAVYSVPITGPAQANIQLSGPVSPSYQIWSIASLAEYSQHVIYTACTNCGSSSALYEIFSAPLTDPSPESVLLANNITGVVGSLIAPGDQHYLYAKNDGIYAVPINGPMGDATKISDISGYMLLSPDQWRVIVRGTSSYALYSLPLLGAHPETIQISPPTIGDYVPYQTSFRLTPNGSRVVYMAGNSSNRIELYATDDGYFIVNHVYLPILYR